MYFARFVIENFETARSPVVLFSDMKAYVKVNCFRSQAFLSLGTKASWEQTVDSIKLNYTSLGKCKHHGKQNFWFSIRRFGVKFWLRWCGVFVAYCSLAQATLLSLWVSE